MRILHIVNRVALGGLVLAAASLPACDGDSKATIDGSGVSDSASPAADATADRSAPADALVADRSAVDSARDTLTPDSLKPDSLKPDTLKPDTLKPDTLKPDTLKPDTLKPDTLKPDTLRPDTLKPDTIPDCRKDADCGKPSCTVSTASLTCSGTTPVCRLGRCTTTTNRVGPSCLPGCRQFFGSCSSAGKCVQGSRTVVGLCNRGTGRCS